MAPVFSRRKWKLIALGLILCEREENLKLKEKTKKPKRAWMKDCYMKRFQLSHGHLLNGLQWEPENWGDLGMDKATYTNLLALVTPLIEKRHTNFREPISPHERLSTTLRYLSTGCRYEELKFNTAISPQAMGRFIPEVCEALNQVLKDYIKFPTTEEEWLTISQDFTDKWNFPNCLGVVDGKHIQIIPQAGSDSLCLDYKGTSSIVLVAIANANHEFFMVDIGTNGQVPDGGVLSNTKFYSRLKAGKLNIPSAKPPPNSPNELPFVFLGDEAFMLREEFLKPFNLHSLTHEQKIFNYRLSRAKRVIENTFGIMASRFRILQTKMNVHMDRIVTIVMTCCTLHNYLRKQCANNYTPCKTLDEENTENGTIALGLRAEPSVMYDIECGLARNADQRTKDVREKFVAYFNEDGQVEWQERMVTPK